MNRRTRNLGLIVGILCSTLCVRSADFEMRGELGVFESRGEFTVCLPYDWKGVEAHWRYEARFVNHEWSSDVHFGWVISLREGGGCELALYKRDAMVDSRFDDIDIEDKAAAAAVSKRISPAIAGSIKKAWLVALRRARYFDMPVTAMDVHYISVFDENGGYKCGSAAMAVENTMSELIIDIGDLVAAYAEAQNTANEERIETEIVTRCAAVMEMGFRP